MNAVYILQTLWRETVTRDVWHVTSTLKRTITKSTLIWVTVLCALHRRFTPGAHATSIGCFGLTSSWGMCLGVQICGHHTGMLMVDDLVYTFKSWVGTWKCGDKPEEVVIWQVSSDCSGCLWYCFTASFMSATEDGNTVKRNDSQVKWHV